MAYKMTIAHKTGRPIFSVDAYEKPKPVQVWRDNKPTGEQAVDENGVPLWTLNVSILLTKFGNDESELVTIQFPSKETPKGLPTDLMTPQQAR